MNPPSRKRKQPSGTLTMSPGQAKSIAVWLYECNDTVSIRDVAKLTNQPYSTTRDAIVKAHKHGLESVLSRRPPDQLPPHMCKKLTAEHLEFIRDTVLEFPHIYLCELANEVMERFPGFSISEATLCDTLNNVLHLPLKASSRLSGEPTPAETARYFDLITRYEPRQLVFMDECCTDRRDHRRRRGRAPPGQRVPHKGAFFVRGKRIASIVAMCQEGIVTQKSFVGGTLDGDTIADTVEQFVIPHMNPFPGDLSVLVLDNASVHHTPELESAAIKAGIRLVFLPPYSPFLNPTEHIFSQVKSFLRRYGPEFRREDLGSDLDLLLFAMNQVSEANCRGYFRKCGYAY